MAKVLPMLRYDYEYTALADYNFKWSDLELRVFRKLWRRGFDIGFIAERLDRHSIEIMVLIMDQGERGYINSREGGIMGNRRQK
jgi:hypothetical protein